MTGSGSVSAKPFDAMSSDEHLGCAVDISAYTYLVAGGQVAKDQALLSKAVLAMAWHHNAYAIPLGKGEQPELINARREAMMMTQAPEEIATRAIRCIGSAEAKRRFRPLIPVGNLASDERPLRWQMI